MNDKEMIQSILKQINRKFNDFPEGIENRQDDIPYYVTSIYVDYDELSLMKILLEKEQLA